MIIFLGERVGCENCIRGHRAADCLHVSKHLISIKGRGRPNSKDKISIRLRIDAGSKPIRSNYVTIENKHKKGASDVSKLCYYIDDNTPVKLYKVKLGSSFRVLGPVLTDEQCYMDFINEIEKQKINLLPGQHDHSINIVPPTEEDIASHSNLAQDNRISPTQIQYQVLEKKQRNDALFADSQMIPTSYTNGDNKHDDSLDFSQKFMDEILSYETQSYEANDTKRIKLESQELSYSNLQDASSKAQPQIGGQFNLSNNDSSHTYHLNSSIDYFTSFLEPIYNFNTTQTENFSNQTAPSDYKNNGLTGQVNNNVIREDNTKYNELLNYYTKFGT